MIVLWRLPALRDRTYSIEELAAHRRYLMSEPVAVSLRAGDSGGFLPPVELPEPCLQNPSLLPDLLTEPPSRSPRLLPAEMLRD